MSKKKKMREHFVHIKKKCYMEIDLGAEKVNQITEMIGANSLDAMKNLKPKDVKNTYPLIFTDTGAYQAFNYDNNGSVCMIPIANPALIYLNSAQVLLRTIEKEKKELLAILRNITNMTEDGLFRFYYYFGNLSTFATQLVNALEAFVNQKIPHKHVYTETVGTAYVKHFDYDQIQRELSLECKIKNILNVVYKKNFIYTYKDAHHHLEKLRQFRNDVVHTKAVEKEPYKELFTDALNFPCLETIYAVKAFINFFEPGLIEHCTCGKDL